MLSFFVEFFSRILIEDRKQDVEEKEEIFIVGSKDKVALEKFIQETKELEQKRSEVKTDEIEQQGKVEMKNIKGNYVIR